MTEPDPTERLREIIDQLPTLDRARLFIERFAEELPIPARGIEDKALAISLLGQRAKSLYDNFHHSLTSPAEIGPILALRPLEELAILTKWISIDPELHAFLYVADSDAAELTHANCHPAARGGSRPQRPAGSRRRAPR